MRFGGPVQLSGAELGECGELTILSKVKPQLACHLLHSLRLSLTADSGYRQTHVERRADAGIEKVRLQVDLAIGDGDDVGWDVGRYICCLSLDYGQRGE